MRKTLMLAVCCILTGSVMNAPAQSAPPNLRNAQQMSIEINGVRIPGARALADLAAVKRQQVGGAALAGQPRETRAKDPDTLVLARPLTTDKEFLAWHASVKEGHTDLRTVTIALVNAEGKSLATYTYRNCMPIRYFGSLGAGQKSNAAMERIKLECESVKYNGK